MTAHAARRGASALAVAAALAGAAGCVYAPGGRCESQGDCAAGEQCQAGVCVLPADVGGGGVDPTPFTPLWSSLAGQSGATFEVDSVGADVDGNVIVAGAVDAAFDFGPDADDDVEAGAFVLKRAFGDGAALWAVSFPTFVHGWIETAVLPGGDVFFAGTAFDPTLIGTVLVTPGVRGTLVVGRMDATTGEPVLVGTIDNTHASADLVPAAVAVSTAGDLLVAGTGSGNFGCPEGDTASNTFAAAVRADGSCNWSRGFGTWTISDLEPRDTGQAAVAGVCTPAGISFDPGGATICTNGLFVAFLRDDGSTEWLKTTSGAGTVAAAHDLAIGPDGRATVIGDAKGVVDFGLGPTDFGASFASFAATWDQSGAPTALVRPIETPYAEEPDAIAFSRCAYGRSGQLWLAGPYVGQPTLGGIRFTACRAPDCGAAAFLAELDVSGDVVSFLPVRAAPVGIGGPAYVDDLVLFATTGTVASALRFTGAGMADGPSWTSAGGALGVLRVAP